MTSFGSSLEPNKDTLRNLLSPGAVLIKFIKPDNTEQIINCTLAEELIPPDQILYNNYSNRLNSNFSVFDLERNCWRSFSWDSVQSIIDPTYFIFCRNSII